MRGAFEALAQGRAINQPRRRLDSGYRRHAAQHGRLLRPNYFGTKFYSTHPEYGAHFYFVLYDAQTADRWPGWKPITWDKSGRARPAATPPSLLANPQAETLAVIGSGFQARTQVEAIRAVRPIKTVRVWSRNEEKRRKFAEECSGQAMSSAEEAVRGAQIVVTSTNSQAPVLEDAWIAPGTMIKPWG